MRRLLLGLLLLAWPMLGFCQVSHEGDVVERMKIGRHVWKDKGDQIIAEVVYDAKGVVISFRTWDEKGLLIDEIKLDPKRDRTDFPTLDPIFEADGFGYELIPGNAAADAPFPTKGERVGVYYEGYLQDGTRFDGNYGAKKPYRYKFDMAEVVPGYDRAVSMLRVGQEGYFWIPASMGYGAIVAGEIPPFSDLIFKIKLVDLN